MKPNADVNSPITRGLEDFDYPADRRRDRAVCRNGAADARTSFASLPQIGDGQNIGRCGIAVTALGQSEFARRKIRADGGP